MKTQEIRKRKVQKKKKFTYLDCGAQVIYGPGPSTRGESRGPSRGGLRSKPDKIKPGKSLGYIQGQFGPRQDR